MVPDGNGDILAASQEGKGLLKKEEEKNNYNDDYLLSRNDYLNRLCEKTGLRSFDEFWEKYFELGGMKRESAKWFEDLLTYCALARENTAQEALGEEGCLAREAYMAERIAGKGTLPRGLQEVFGSASLCPALAFPGTLSPLEISALPSPSSRRFGSTPWLRTRPCGS